MTGTKLLWTWALPAERFINRYPCFWATEKSSELGVFENPLPGFKSFKDVKMKKFRNDITLTIRRMATGKNSWLCVIKAKALWQISLRLVHGRFLTRPFLKYRGLAESYISKAAQRFNKLSMPRKCQVNE